MNKETKRNINAFLLAMGLIMLVGIGICILILIGKLLGIYLPYVVIGLMFIGFGFILSLPIRDYLIERDIRNEWKKRNK